MEKVIKVTLQGGGAVVYIPVSSIAYVQNQLIVFKSNYTTNARLLVNETADQMGTQMR